MYQKLHEEYAHIYVYIYMLSLCLGMPAQQLEDGWGNITLLRNSGKKIEQLNVYNDHDPTSTNCKAGWYGVLGIVQVEVAELSKFSVTHCVGSCCLDDVSSIVYCIYF